jgi:hypothetical protein
MAIRRDIFTHSGDYYFPMDFNEYFQLMPGDIVIVPAGKYGSLEIFKANGITFINEGGQAEFKFISFYQGTQNMAVLGNGSPGTQFGFKCYSPNHFGGLFETVNRLVLQNIHVEGTTMGFQVLTKPGASYPGNEQILNIENCLIEKVKDEGLYLGADALGGPWIVGNIRNNVLRNCGRDGIQVRNGFFNVENNVIEGTGGNGEEWHSHGILFGGNSNGGICKNNKVSGVGGIGLFINGMGDFQIQGNSFQSQGSAVFINNYADKEDLQRVGFQRVTIKGNKLVEGNGKSLEVLRDPAKAPQQVDFYYNEYSGHLEVQPGVVFNHAAQIPDPVEPVPVKLLWTAIKNKRKYNVYSDNTWKWQL